MSAPKTIIIAVINKDNVRVFQNTMEHQSISAYFMTPNFAEFAANAEVDSDMLSSISNGLTVFIRQESEINNTLKWARNADAVCVSASVAPIKDSDDVQVLFLIEIVSNE